MIIRTLRTGKKYTSVLNDAIYDTRLSFRARGVLVWLLSKSDDWEPNADRMAAEAPEGRDAIRTCFRELEAAGYLTRKLIAGDKGRWSTVLSVHETPLESPTTGFQSSGNQSSVDQSSENQASNQSLIPNTDTKGTLGAVPAPVRETDPAFAEEAALPGPTKLNSNTLAEYLTTDIAKRMREYGHRPAGRVNTRALAAAIKRIKAEYELDDAGVKTLMDIYASSPSVWNGNKHHAWDFCSANTLAVLLRMHGNISGETGVDDLDDEYPQGIAHRYFYGEESEGTASA